MFDEKCGDGKLTRPAQLFCLDEQARTATVASTKSAEAVLSIKGKRPKTKTNAPQSTKVVTQVSIISADGTYRPRRSSSRE